MIGEFNTLHMTDTERRDSLYRAMHTQPFYNLLTFPVAIGTLKRDAWGDKVDVNKNFYLTELIGNFDEANDETGSLFSISVYASQNQGSVYNYMQTINLPSGFVANEARSSRVAFATQLFDDRQFEYCPYLIKAGDRVIGRVANLEDKIAAFDVQLMLKGYYVMPQRHLNDNALRGVNESLEKDIRFETWPVTITNTAQNSLTTYSFNNDRKARMILGFGIVDDVESGDNPISYAIELLDTSRNIKWNNKPMPIEFLGPRVGSTSFGVRDLPKYFLPVEYLWEPFSNLQAMIRVTEEGDTNIARLVMYTRTV